MYYNFHVCYCVSIKIIILHDHKIGYSVCLLKLFLGEEGTIKEATRAKISPRKHDSLSQNIAGNNWRHWPARRRRNSPESGRKDNLDWSEWSLLLANSVMGGTSLKRTDERIGPTTECKGKVSILGLAHLYSQSSAPGLDGR